MGEAIALDRRHRRRQETIEQVLAVAVEVMGEQGVAGLTLGEVARRMEIRTPSLYGYFDGKNALYDALFQRGWAELLAAFVDATGHEDPLADFHAAAETFVRWSVEHPAYAPLMFWRPVPGFTPSEAAYAAAAETTQRGRELAGAAAGRRCSRRGLRPGPGLADLVGTAHRRRHPAAGQRAGRAVRGRQLHRHGPPAHRHVAGPLRNPEQLSTATPAAEQRRNHRGEDVRSEPIPC